MLRYSLFLAETFIKRASLYALLFLSILGAIAEVLIFSFASNYTKHQSGLDNINRIYLLVPFFISVVFTIFLVLHNFKWSEARGLGLRIVVKPFTRSQIVGGRFLTTIIFVFLYHVFLFLVYLFVCNIDSYATANVKALFAISIAFGGFIVSILITSLSILAITLFKKSVAVTAAIMGLAVFFPAFSIVFLFGSHPNEFRSSISKNSIVNSVVVKNQNDNSSHEYPSTNLKSAISSRVSNDIFGANGTVLIAQSSPEKSWYRKVAPIDFWNQLTNFYSLFVNEDKYDELTPVKLSSSNKVFSGVANYEAVSSHMSNNDSQDFAIVGAAKSVIWGSILDGYYSPVSGTTSLSAVLKSVQSGSVYSNTSIAHAIYESLSSENLDLGTKMVILGKLIDGFQNYDSNIMIQQTIVTPPSITTSGNKLEDWLSNDVSDKLALKALNENVFSVNKTPLVLFDEITNSPTQQQFDKERIFSSAFVGAGGYVSVDDEDLLKYLPVIMADVMSEFPDVAKVNGKLSPEEVSALNMGLVEINNNKFSPASQMETSAYNPMKVVVPIWTLIAFFSIGGSFALCCRKDFK